MEAITFESFPKIPRFASLGGVTITEKLDGTNAQVIITDSGEVGAASRSRLISPGKDTDNYGFAAWVQENREELLKLGPGRHFGEWWGLGIQREYGLEEKRFSLFNTKRWNDRNPNRPACCSVVPVLYEGPWDGEAIDYYMSRLKGLGSVAAPGFMDPEGIVIWMMNGYSKRTFDNDKGKWSNKSVFE